jgi:hypothetical protein
MKLLISQNVRARISEFSQLPDRVIRTNRRRFVQELREEGLQYAIGVRSRFGDAYGNCKDFSRYSWDGSVIGLSTADSPHFGGKTTPASVRRLSLPLDNSG